MLTRVFLFFLTLQLTFAVSSQEIENNSASKTTTQSEPAPATPDLSQYHEGDPTPKEWGPHIVDHLFKGCPTNALCSRETGEILDEFKSLLDRRKDLKTLNLFKDKSGIPFEVYGNDPALKIQNLHVFHWESPCANHNIEGQKIYQTGLLIKNISEIKSLSQKKKMFPRFALVEENKKSIKKITIMRGDAPLYFDRLRPVFVQEFENNFYGVLIDGDGSLKIIDQIRPELMPDSHACSKDLLQSFQNEDYPRNVYSSYFCQKIYDINLKKQFLVLVPRGCH